MESVLDLVLPSSGEVFSKYHEFDKYFVIEEVRKWNVASRESYILKQVIFSANYVAFCTAIYSFQSNYINKSGRLLQMLRWRWGFSNFLTAKN